ncbi:hypothetical protein QEH59_00530 [Coraliomargarita sp. SDUM461004]|uniref:Uncharacterized protein n=1 Tax=Thalassobacterium sedimentorum TaxID=3041258 RepID=A0ABU1AEG2_9BACT|nr:hypothetical protein [Coraliomargarita sp. SDUM461004]MDQ8192889.1 hypothetical protein [Coraliomargarita sp. SDUM461004]
MKSLLLFGLVICSRLNLIGTLLIALTYATANAARPQAEAPIVVSDSGAEFWNSGELILAMNVGNGGSGSTTINKVVFQKGGRYGNFQTQNQNGVSLTVSVDPGGDQNNGIAVNIYENTELDDPFDLFNSNFLSSFSTGWIQLSFSGLKIGQSYRLQTFHLINTGDEVSRDMVFSQGGVPFTANFNQFYSGGNRSADISNAVSIVSTFTADSASQTIDLMPYSDDRCYLNALALYAVEMPTDYTLGDSWNSAVDAYTASLYLKGDPKDSLEDFSFSMSYQPMDEDSQVLQSVLIENSTYNPSDEGELLYLDFSSTCTSNANTSYSLGLIQDGHSYWSQGKGEYVTIEAGSTRDIALNHLVASDFKRIDGSSGFPDFKETGSPITFQLFFQYESTDANVQTMTTVSNLRLSNYALTEPDILSERRDWILESSSWNSPTIGNNLKNDGWLALIKLYQSAGTDANSLEFLSSSLDDTIVSESNWNDNDKQTFYPVPLVRGIHTFGDSFTPQQLALIESKVRSFSNWASDGGTENHYLMRWTNAYLLAQKFDGEWYSGTVSNGTVTTAEFMGILKSKLLAEGAFRFQEGGMGEYLSPNYLQTHILPLLNLYDFTEDPELKDAAEAMLHLHLTHLALNAHNGYILEPHSRFGGKQFVNGYKVQNNSAQFLTWLYFGQMNRPDDIILSEEFLIGCALSNYRPAAYTQDLANGSSDSSFPYETRSAVVHNPHISERMPRTTLRSVYRTEKYSIGTAYTKFMPDGYYMQHSNFGIAWNSLDDELASLSCGHPYWRADSARASWAYSTASPFQQIAHDKNTAIVLFNIPMADPWPQRGRSDWIAERDDHAQDLIKYGVIYLPQMIGQASNLSQSNHYIDQIVKADWDYESDGQIDGKWYFLREADVYIGILALTTGGMPDLETDRKMIFANGLQQGDYFQTGFIFEIGTESEFGNFETFIAQVQTNQINLNWDTSPNPAPYASYTDSQGDLLTLTYNSTQAEDSIGVINNLPTVTINGETLAFDQTWPDIEGPGILLENGIFSLKGPKENFLINWSNTLPTITYSRQAIQSDSYSAWKDANGYDALSDNSKLDHDALSLAMEWAFNGEIGRNDNNRLPYLNFVKNDQVNLIYQRRIGYENSYLIQESVNLIEWQSSKWGSEIITGSNSEMEEVKLSIPTNLSSQFFRIKLVPQSTD